MMIIMIFFCAVSDHRLFVVMHESSYCLNCSWQYHGQGFNQPWPSPIQDQIRNNVATQNHIKPLCLRLQAIIADLFQPMVLPNCSSPWKRSAAAKKE